MESPESVTEDRPELPSGRHELTPSEKNAEIRKWAQQRKLTTLYTYQDRLHREVREKLDELIAVEQVIADRVKVHIKK